MRISDWSSDVCSSDLGMGGQAMRGYTLDVSEYLFRLTTESLRIHSNQTRRYQSLGNIVNARATAGAAGAIEQHDAETPRKHLQERQSVVLGKRGSVRVARVGRRTI